MDTGGELNAWLGKPPGKIDSNVSSEDEVVAEESSTGSPSPSVSSQQSLDVIAIPHRPLSQQPSPQVKSFSRQAAVVAINDEDPDELLDGDAASESDTEFVVSRQDGLTIKLPELSEDEKDEFEHLPGHFDVQRVLYATGDSPTERGFVVKLASGEFDLVSKLTLRSETVFTERLTCTGRWSPTYHTIS